VALGLAAGVAAMSCSDDGDASSELDGGSGGSGDVEAAARSSARVFAIEHVTVLPMTEGGEALEDATIVVRDGRIVALGAADETRAPAAARRIDGHGKWLMPALADCHVHVENDRFMRLLLGDSSIPAGSIDDADIFVPYVAYGVLQVANLGAMSEAIGQRDAVESGRVLGPHMTLAAMIDGQPPIWPVGFTRVAATAADGRQAVRDVIAEGYDMIKVYSRLDLATFTAIVDEARTAGRKVVGHIPARGTGTTAAFFQPGYRMVAHAEEFFLTRDDTTLADIPGFVAMMAGNGTGLTTTLTLDERILDQTRDPSTLMTRPEMALVHPLLKRFWIDHNPYAGRNTPERIDQLERLIEFNRALVAASVEAGVPVLPGTDALVPGVVPGASLHDELEVLARAGMSSEAVLEAATRRAAEWLDVASDRGTVEVGKRADLILLDADPREDVANTRRLAAVIAGARYLPRAELDAMVAALEARYAAED